MIQTKERISPGLPIFVSVSTEIIVIARVTKITQAKVNQNLENGESFIIANV